MGAATTRWPENPDDNVEPVVCGGPQGANAVTIEALAKLVPSSQIVFRSDVPTARRRTTQGCGPRRAVESVRWQVLREIARENATRILPNVREA
jgi:hypothetical protein